jgi:hypothetical protein
MSSGSCETSGLREPRRAGEIDSFARGRAAIRSHHGPARLARRLLGRWLEQGVDARIDQLTSQVLISAEQLVMRQP